MKEIIIDKENDTRKIMLLENGKLVEYYEENNEYNRLEGNIYLGKIRNVLPGIQAAFVDIGEGKNTFIQVKDIYPKIDQTIQNIENTKNIKEVAKPGMNLIVQVKKDASNKKGARVSTHISLPGEYIVLMPDVSFITVSQKIENEEKKEELKQILKEILPENFGAIIRTSAENVDGKVLKNEVDLLIKMWEDIKQRASKSNEIEMIYKSDDIVSKIIKGTISQNISKITVNDEKQFEYVNKILSSMQAKNNINVELHNNLLEKYDLNKQIEKMSQRKIYLKCGGFITIDKTEALTAIDVNSGKYTGKESQEKTILKVNEEATEEIAKQLRLRDIDGIIIIDYIDMNKEESKLKIIETLKQNIKKDRSKIQILEFTKLNLLEITRKHMFSNKI